MVARNHITGTIPTRGGKQWQTDDSTLVHAPPNYSVRCSTTHQTTSTTPTHSLIRSLTTCPLTRSHSFAHSPVVKVRAVFNRRRVEEAGVLLGRWHPVRRQRRDGVRVRRSSDTAGTERAGCEGCREKQFHFVVVVELSVVELTNRYVLSSPWTEGKLRTNEQTTYVYFNCQPDLSTCLLWTWRWRTTTIRDGRPNKTSSSCALRLLCVCVYVWAVRTRNVLPMRTRFVMKGTYVCACTVHVMYVLFVCHHHHVVIITTTHTSPLAPLTRAGHASADR